MTKKGQEKPLGVIKVKNGYMVTEGKTMYETPYHELMVFTSFASMTRYLSKKFNDK